MTRALFKKVSLLALIYGDDLFDDFEFCTKHSKVIDLYSHAIMTISGGGLDLLEKEMLANRSNTSAKNREEAKILEEFYARLINNRIRHLSEIGRLLNVHPGFVRQAEDRIISKIQKEAEPMKTNKKKAPRVIKGGKMTPKEKEAFHEELDEVLTKNLPITQEFEDKLDVALFENDDTEAAEFVSTKAYAAAKKRLAAKKTKRKL
ncbi:MAG: hypothetical protein WCS94_02455 [Verrucomicrobiota bacterium]